MSTCTFKTYKSEITPDKNMYLEHIEEYLATYATLALNFSSFSYLKISKEFNVKVQISQGIAQATGVGNYARVEQDSKIYYFFITGYNWVAQETCMLSLAIDSVQTFYNQLTFSDKTNILRQHKDRFKATDRFTENTAFTLHKQVDNVSENLSGIVLYKDSDTTITEPITTQDVDTNFYLIYRTPETTEANKPIEISLVSKDAVRVDTGYAETRTITPSDILDDAIYYMTYVDNLNAIITYGGGDHDIDNNEVFYFKKYNSTSFSVCLSSKNESIVWTHVDTYTTLTFKANCNFAFYNYTETSSLYDIERINNKLILKTGSADYRYLRTLSSIDRTDSHIIKILELPYLPTQLRWLNDQLITGGYWTLDYRNELVLNNVAQEFERKIKTYQLNNLINVSESAQTKANFVKKAYNAQYESKLLNSEIFSHKFTYDNFSFNFAFERFTVDYSNNIDIYFKPSNTLSSDIIFKFTFASSAYKEIQDYETFLFSNRNNEVSIYTSEYLNYMRTGYNFDLKNKTQTETSSYLASALQIVGAVASFAGSAATGGLSAVAGISLLTSGIASLASSINTTASTERTMQQKLEQLKAQANSISANNDIDLFNYYNGNKLHLQIYKPSAKLQEDFLDLFRKYGYALGSTGTPNTTSRYWWNYIQCEPIFTNLTTNAIYNDYLDDIKARFEAGITIYHAHLNGTTYEYDLTQQYENWENSLFEE